MVSVTCALGLFRIIWALGFCGRVGAGLAVLGAHLAPPHCTLVSVLVSLAGLTQSCSEGSEQPRVAGRGMHY